MRSLVGVLIAAGLGACVPEDVEFDHPVQPASGRVVSGTSEGTGGDNNNNGGQNPIGNDAGVGGDGGTVITDGGVFDAGPFLDAFDFPMDAGGGIDNTDQIP